MTLIPADCTEKTTRKARRVLFLHLTIFGVSVHLLRKTNERRDTSEEQILPKHVSGLKTRSQEEKFQQKTKKKTYCRVSEHLEPTSLHLLVEHNLFLNLDEFRVGSQIQSVSRIMMDSLKDLPGGVILTDPDEPSGGLWNPIDTDEEEQWRDGTET